MNKNYLIFIAILVLVILNFVLAKTGGTSPLLKGIIVIGILIVTGVFVITGFKKRKKKN